MAARSPFWIYVKDELVRHLKSTDFLGFLGICLVVMPFSFLIDRGSDTPIYSHAQTIFNIVGLIAGVFFSYLVAQGFAKEFEKRTLNILLTTPLGRTRLFLGKLLVFISLIPIFLAVLALGFIPISYASGKMPHIQVIISSYYFLMLGLFLVSVIAFSMVLSILMKKTGSMMVIMSIYIFLPMLMAQPLGLIYGNDDTRTINYPVNFLLPSCLYSVSFALVYWELGPNWSLISIQLVFLALFITMGYYLFRRAQIWG